jgi:hypothetical protein
MWSFVQSDIAKFQNGSLALQVVCDRNTVGCKTAVGVPSGATFAPPWGLPYQNFERGDARFEPGCPGAWRLTFNYELENGYDFGHLIRSDTGSDETFTGTGSRSYDLRGSVRFTLLADYSETRAGFTNVKGICL